ncbi:hypothetical protein FEM54_01920 [Pseudomonas edaphica]|uniref:Uncharacterized protein n=1 Tax=Pseudomonas edaphica TaxID=2006980 RepID=A0ABY2UB88_9PSED|nr:hypothetical protein FEM54_01920 [Pseudomonas edaphica]
MGHGRTYGNSEYRCGSGLARDAGTSVFQQYRGDAIAAVRRSDKPAPTKASSPMAAGTGPISNGKRAA